MKQSTINMRSVTILAIVLLVAVGFTMLFATDVSQAKTTNKAVKVGMSFTGVSYADVTNPDSPLSDEEKYQATVDNSYSMGATFKSKIALKPDMKVSGTLYIPKKMLNAEDCTVNVLPLILCDDGTEEGTFNAESKYVAVVSYTNKKVGVKVYESLGDNQYNDVTDKNNAKISLDKSKTKYILQLKNMPLEVLPKEGVEIPADKKYKTSVIISLMGWGKQCGAFLYMDNLKLSAVKTTSIKFNTKDYNKIFAFRTLYQAHELPYQRVTMK